MPTIKTPCSSCKFFTELLSTLPGESWNRCSHEERRLETKYPCRVNSYGYADNRCGYYTESRGAVIRRGLSTLSLFGARHEK